MDETDHSFTTETDRGGSRSISYGSNEDGRKGRRGTRSSRHTTGVYLCDLEIITSFYVS